MLLAVAGAGAATPAAGQPTSAQAHPGESVQVYLLTMGPGDYIWEQFGHNAIWIRDPTSGTDVAYNWGTFDFAAADFLPRLVKGDMLYWMVGLHPGRSLEEYHRRDRDVWVHELNLTPDQRLELVDLLRRTDTDQNRYYSYDYYLDNCSTRIRDLLDQVLGGTIREQVEPLATGTTWRWHARRIVRRKPAAYVGMELALGNPADESINAWEESFLPLRLLDRLRAVTVPDGQGGRAPLLLSERRLVESTRPAPPPAPPFWLPWFLAVGLSLSAVVLTAGRVAESGRGWGRVAAFMAAILWNTVAGLGGTLLAGAWLFTQHTFWFWNENLFQANSLSLLLVLVLLPAALGRDPPRAAFPLAAAVAGLSLLGLVLQLLPVFAQVNGEVISLALPAHLSVVWITARAAPRGEVAGRHALGP